MFEILNSLGIKVHTQKIINKIKSRDLSKEEKKVIYRKNYINPIEDKSTEVDNYTYSDFINSEETNISINVLQTNKNTCYDIIESSINNTHYFKKTFTSKLNDKHLSDLKQAEVKATQLSKKHIVNFTAENAEFVAQSSYTKGEIELKINYNIDPSGIIIKQCLVNNPNSDKSKINTRNFSIVEVKSKPVNDVNTAIILETPLFNRYKLSNSFDIENVTNKKDKSYIQDILNNYNIKDSKKLEEKLREEFSIQKFILLNDEFSSINQPLQRNVEDDIIKNRYNKPIDYGLINDVLNDILKN